MFSNDIKLMNFLLAALTVLCGSGEDDFSILSMYFRNCVSISSWQNSSCEKNDSPLPKDDLCQVLLKLPQWFWRRIWKCEKLTTTLKTTQQTTDKFWSEGLTRAFCSGELTGINSIHIIITVRFLLFLFYHFDSKFSFICWISLILLSD